MNYKDKTENEPKYRRRVNNATIVNIQERKAAHR